MNIIKKIKKIDINEGQIDRLKIYCFFLKKQIVFNFKGQIENDYSDKLF